MKHWIILIGLFYSLQNLSAQYFNYGSGYANLEKYSVIDSAYLKCSYKLTYLKYALNTKVQSTDLQVLLIGKNVSKYYSQYKLDYCNFIVDYLKKGHDTYPSINEEGAWSYEVFKNYPQGKQTVTDIASILLENFVYEEELPVFEWRLGDEKQTVLSYSCQKATVSFRGRDFIAWFTTDIPVSNGPWKFGGLPGLILKLSDSENNFIYECQGLEQLKNKEPVKFYKLDYTKISRKELDKLYRRFHDDYAAYRVATRGQGIYIVDPKTNKATYTEHASTKIPYNPIELE